MTEKDVVLKLLAEIERDPAVSQKKLATEVGISVGMINWHVKRCVSKGLIKLQQAPVKRYLYYLTPDGFSEKANLTAKYLQSSLSIFRIGREQYNTLFDLCQANNWRKVALLGNTELSELAQMVAASRNDVKISDIFAIPYQPASLLAISDKPDAAIVTHFLTSDQPLSEDEAFITNLGLTQDCLLIPHFLR